MENEKRSSYFIQSISVWDMLKAVLSRWYLILIVAILGGAIAGVYTKYQVAPTYDAYTTLYVFNKAEDDINGSISSSDLTASADLAETYKVLLSSRTLREAVIKEVKENNPKYAMNEFTTGYLSSAVNVSSVNETQVIRITVTTTDPELSAAIANAYAFVSPVQMTELTEVGKVNVVDYAIVPSAPSSPSMTANCTLGFLIGALVVCVILILAFITDTVLRDSDDIEKVTKVSIFGTIPTYKIKSADKSVSFTIVKGRNILDEE